MKIDALHGKKVLYLDFDGVLHHSAVFADPSKPFEPYLDPCVSMLGHKLFQHADLLAKLVPDDVVIVLSTSWANLPKHSTNWAKAWLPPALQDKVVGRTLDVWTGPRKFRAMPRGHQVLRHAAQFKPYRWFALDDDSSGFDAIPHNYVKTDWKLGIVPVVDRIKEIFDNWSKI